MIMRMMGGSWRIFPVFAIRKPNKFNNETKNNNNYRLWEDYTANNRYNEHLFLNYFNK